MSGPQPQFTTAISTGLWTPVRHELDVLSHSCDRSVSKIGREALQGLVQYYTGAESMGYSFEHNLTELSFQTFGKENLAWGAERRRQTFQVEPTTKATLVEIADHIDMTMSKLAATCITNFLAAKIQKK